jgi:hypothetical protein
LPAWWEIYKSRGQRNDMYIVLNSDILWYIYLYIYVVIYISPSLSLSLSICT